MLPLLESQPHVVPPFSNLQSLFKGKGALMGSYTYTRYIFCSALGGAVFLMVPVAPLSALASVPVDASSLSLMFPGVLLSRLRFAALASLLLVNTVSRVLFFPQPFLVTFQTVVTGTSVETKCFLKAGTKHKCIPHLDEYLQSRCQISRVGGWRV